MKQETRGCASIIAYPLVFLGDPTSKTCTHNSVMSLAFETIILRNGNKFMLAEAFE